MYCIKFFNGGNSYWLAKWTNGDPPRTHDKENARTFKTVKSAKVYRTKIVNKNQDRYRGLDIDEISIVEPV